MQIILENYLIIIIIGLFLVFALVGFLIDMLRKVDNNNTNEEIPSNIEPIEITPLKETSEKSVNNETNNADELLENYDKEDK